MRALSALGLLALLALGALSDRKLAARRRQAPFNPVPVPSAGPVTRLLSTEDAARIVAGYPHFTPPVSQRPQ
ncbi:hypothetical protein ABID82_004252 [Methylobacterium sp. PvP062]|uniref:Uncharacterized protein n=1 Tax=Methylobacterium radiotolerans TaxID=31998 RepID=A0ABV2NLF2_9HYPH|nr:MULTISPECIES: hypothetical protein [unclassified Methylobacterium]KZC01416.1 hypothetical protein AU375_02340 [Methylobacterium radiotolerans]MBP2496014.1 hypothetical protein [Methylobacterium sp. PvP105]MBP2504115.1 hypothetical protein [Methylobacterium sp. PvP109]MCX7333095.1 hypothetical protein [Hyphomicrobiales bacterium]